MPQAKVLSKADLKRVLAIVAVERHAERNRIAIFLSLLAGMRAGEIASLRVQSVLDARGNVRDEIRLSPQMTKGNRPRTVFVNKRLQRELRRYLRTLPGMRFHPDATAWPGCCSAAG